MASERAIVFGRCGSISLLYCLTAVEIGEHPVACAPKELHRLRLDQAEQDQFIKRLLDLGDQRPARHRDDDVVRQTPSQLLGDFVAHRLRAFGVVRTQVDVHESPAMLVGNLRAQTVHVVVAAVDAHQFRAEHLRAENLRRLEIGRNEDPRLEAFARRLRRDRIREVARRRAGDGIESKARAHWRARPRRRGL